MKYTLNKSLFLADSSFFYSIAIGMDSKYAFVSDNYNRNFDPQGGSLLGKAFSITLHPDDIAICAEVGMRCFETPGQLFPATLRKHDGLDGFVVTQWEMKSFFNKEGLPLGIFCIGYNITEYVDTRTKLEDANSIIAVKNDQLREIGFMQSHVVHKPLANIMGLASMLELIVTDSEQKSLTGKLVCSANELDLVIREFSDKVA